MEERYTIPEAPEYREEIRKLQNDDPASAEKTFNPLFARIIENIAAVKRMLTRKGDRLGYTQDGELGLYAGEELLSSVPVTGSGGEGGTTDHRQLLHRDAEEQHPIEAITGLGDALADIPRPMTAAELQTILNGGNEHEQHI